MRLASLPLMYLFFFLQGWCFGQEISIRDAEKGLPLPGVLVYSSDPGLTVMTNTEGKADLTSFNGKKNLMIQLLGYQSLAISWEELSQKDFILYLHPSPITLDIAVISASRWNQNSQEVAGKVRHLDSQQLLLRNPANAADWLGSSGEVFIQKSQMGGGSPMIRGFSANRLLYAVDGIRMNTAIFRSGNLQNVISIDPFSLKNTEVLFGPGSVMYGSDAIGGVMVFETLSPDLDQKKIKGTVLTRLSSASGEKTVHASVAYGKGKWSFLTSATHFDFGDLTMGKVGGQESYLRTEYVLRENGTDVQKVNSNPYRQIGSGYSQVNLMQKVNWEANEKSKFEYGFHFSSTSNLPRYDRLIEKREGRLRFSRWEYGPQKWMMNNLRWNYRNSTKWFDQIKVIGAYQLFEESRIDRRFGDLLEYNRLEKVHAYSLNADFLKNFEADNFLSYGVEGVINTVASGGFSKNISTLEKTPASVRYPNSSWSSLAAYASYHDQLSKKWKFQTAFRYNLNGIRADFSSNREFFPLPFSTSKDQFHSVTGNLGVIFQPEPSFSIAPLISTGFRAPNVDDIGKIFDSEPGAVLVPNPNLRPEYAYNAEINLNKHIQNWIKIDFTGFYTLLDQALVRRPFTLNGQSEIVYDGELSQVLAIQNGAFAEIVGFQSGFEIAIHKRLLWSSTYNWQKGTEELEDQSTSPSRHAAPAFGLTRLAYLGQKLKLDLSMQYSAEMPFEKMPLEEIGKPAIYARDANGNPYSPGWLVFHLNSTYQLNPILQISAAVENITDQQYRSYSSGIVAPGRNFTLSVKGSF
ncbi:MAG: TonB-dependent receptor plug domain-containing protein [Algoriphagus aquaeductus]|uniref:TonB-dependent receptor plug domain-containing protein n=1 Tax=Algoriphagus aquaeductus TaxID=475299 RepID=UPI00387A05C7